MSLPQRKHVRLAPELYCVPGAINSINILNNPVRAGIVEEWRQYPFSGSFVYQL